jgi:predicted flap endonuclease-1-like 5' DNA nuclease
MLRSIIAAFVALLVAGAGLALFVWLLWLLWKRREEETPAAAIELKAGVPEAEIEAERPAPDEEFPDAEVDELVAEVPEVEAEAPAVDVEARTIQAEAEDLEAAEPSVVEPATPQKPDDLKRIEGIGPKIASVLQAAGVMTFSQLADTDVDQLLQILEDADPRLLRLADPSTWPQQASLAAADDWDGLKAFQSELKAGRKT